MRNYTLLIVTALPMEMKAVKQVCKTISMPGISLKFLCSGVGNYNTLYELQKYLQKSEAIDFIVNVGVCGKKNTEVDNNVLQVYRIKNLANQKESLCPLYINMGNLQSIGCSEQVITSPEYMEQEVYVDMESYAVDFIAKKEKIPHSIIKLPFDSVSEGSKNVDKDALMKLLGDYDYSSLFHTIYTWCEKNITEEPDWEKHKKHFSFTVAELEIFKKQYNKFLAFDLDVVDFIETNKSLGKKDILQQMTDTQHAKG